MKSSPAQEKAVLTALHELSLKLRGTGVPVAPNPGDVTNLGADIVFDGYEKPLPGVKFAVFTVSHIFIDRDTPDEIQIEVPENSRKLQVVVV